jgi:hypothetical protein
MPSVRTLSNLQHELIKLYSADIKEEDLLHIKQYLASYFANKAIDEADTIWEQKGYTNDTMKQWLNEDNPTHGNETRD